MVSGLDLDLQEMGCAHCGHVFQMRSSVLERDKTLSECPGCKADLLITRSIQQKTNALLIRLNVVAVPKEVEQPKVTPINIKQLVA